MDGRGSDCDAMDWDVAAAEPTRDGEESFPPSVAGQGSSRGLA